MIDFRDSVRWAGATGATAEDSLTNRGDTFAGNGGPIRCQPPLPPALKSHPCSGGWLSLPVSSARVSDLLREDRSSPVFVFGPTPPVQISRTKTSLLLVPFERKSHAIFKRNTEGVHERLRREIAGARLRSILGHRVSPSEEISVKLFSKECRRFRNWPYHSLAVAIFRDWDFNVSSCSTDGRVSALRPRHPRQAAGLLDLRIGCLRCLRVWTVEKSTTADRRGPLQGHEAGPFLDSLPSMRRAIPGGLRTRFPSGTYVERRGMPRMRL
jgi:hypothetical protein